MKNTQTATYKQLFDRAFEGVLVFDDLGGLLFLNKVAAQLLDLMGKAGVANFSELFGDKLSYEKTKEQCLLEGVFSCTCHGVNIKAQYFDDNEHLLLYLDQNGGKLGEGGCPEVGEFSSLVEEAADSFFIISPELRILNVNKSACLLSGYTKEELLKIKHTELFSKDELKDKPFDLEKVFAGRTVVFERRFLRKDGTEVHIEMRTKKLSNGNLLSITRDVSSRTEIREQLESKNKELEKAYDHVIKSETRYKQLFKNLPLGIFTASRSGQIESINNQMLEILGSSSAELSMNFNLFDLPTLKDTKLLRDFKSCIEEKESHYKLYEYTSIWDKKLYLKTHILPVGKDDETKILVIVEDYSKEREKEHKLRILSQGVNNSPASIVVTDENGIIKFVNKRFTELTGYSPEELIDQKPAILKSGFHPKEFYDELWKTIRAGNEWVGEFKNKKKNGEVFWEMAMISALKDEKGHITNFMAIKEDITTRKKVEKELKFKTQQLTGLVTNLPDNICFKGEYGEWILANKSLLTFFGLEGIVYQGKTNEELIKLSTGNIKYLKDDAKSDNKAWEKKALIKYEAEVESPEGENRILEVLKLPLFHTTGERKGIVNIGRDITRRKQYEHELKEAKDKAEEADTLKSAFLANMSHEIRTPLNAIMGFSSLMSDYELDEKSVKRFVDIIQVNGKQLLTIIDDILLVSKLQVNQIKVTEADFELNQVLSKLEQHFAKEIGILSEKDIKLSINRSGVNKTLKIKTDRDKLFQIYSKLIRNAIKFTNEGEIEFGFRLLVDHRVVFFVKDTGVGISDEKKEIVFKKFRQADDSTTRQYGGTGLGLSIVKGLIDLLKGDLWLESKQDKGTTFYFNLPLEKVELGEDLFDIPKMDVNWKNKKVLIVDDVKESLYLLSELLKRTGIEIITANSGMLAIRIFKEQDDIDLVLMDIQLPGMNGLQTSKELKKINPKVPIIVQTAFSQSDYEEKSKAAGCDDIVFKPIVFTDLLTKMKKYL